MKHQFCAPDAARRFRIATSAGPIGCRIAGAAFAAERPPLVVVHGISRNADEAAALFGPAAERAGRMVIAPHFAKKAWPGYQVINRRRRPDIALLELFSALRDFGVIKTHVFDLFGYSGGGQFAHRFAMLYPQRVRALHLGAPGWYCMPNDGAPFPYGLGRSASGDATWPARKGACLDAFLSLPVRLWIGGADDDPRDPALRRNDLLDAAQGDNRLARARRWLDAFRQAAAARGHSPRARLTLLENCGHSLSECVLRGGLDRALLTDR